MKKLIIFLVIAIGAFAETVSVDLDFLLKSHPKTATVKKEIQNKKVALEKDLNTKGTKLKTDYETLVKKGTKITDADKESFAKKEKELQTLYISSQKQLSELEAKKINALLAEIKTAVNNYAKSKKYDAVVEKKTIYYGNTKIKDVSNEVLKLLKK
jgi:Skp family chaperone for outer membrane proteins